MVDCNGLHPTNGLWMVDCDGLQATNGLWMIDCDGLQATNGLWMVDCDGLHDTNGLWMIDCDGLQATNGLWMVDRLWWWIKRENSLVYDSVTRRCALRRVVTLKSYDLYNIATHLQRAHDPQFVKLDMTSCPLRRKNKYKPENPIIH